MARMRKPARVVQLALCTKGQLHNCTNISGLCFQVGVGLGDYAGGVAFHQRVKRSLNQYQGGMCISGRSTMTERTPRHLISPLGPNWVGTDSAV